MKKILTIFLCLCFVQMHIVSAKMQDKIYLTGNVLDKNKQPIESAYIEIKYSDNKLMGYSLSDSLGFFSIPIENCKKFFIQINHISYHMYEKEYSLTSSLRNLVFMLEEKTNEMSEIVITANSRKSLKLVDGALLFTPTVLGNISTYNLSGLLKKLPSMQISSSGLSMNGRTVSLYINGRKKELLGQSIQAFLNSVPADRIKEISIYPGATGEDVATEMGRVDVILKKVENASSMTVKTELNWKRKGLYGNQTVFVMYNSNRFKFDANVAYYNYYNRTRSIWYMSYLSNEASSEFEYMTRNREHDWFGDINMEWDLASNHKLYVSFNSFYDTGREKSFSDLNLYAEDFEKLTDGYTHRKYSDDLYVANVEFATNRNKNNWHSISYSYIWGKANNKGKAEETKDGLYSEVLTNNHHNGGQHQLKYKYSYKINEKHTFNAGVRTDFSWLTPESRIGNEKNAMMYNEEYDLAENLYAAYVNYKYKKCAWSWMIGLRGEYSDFSAELGQNQTDVDYKKMHIFPSISVNWDAGSWADFSLLFSSGIDRPPFLYYVPNYKYVSEYSYSMGNPALDPSKFYTINLTSLLFDFFYIQLGYSLVTDKYGSVTLAGDSDFQNVTTYRNLCKEDNFKVEANCPYVLLNNKISGNLGILGSRSFFRDYKTEIMNIRDKESAWRITNFTQFDLTERFNMSYSLIYQSKSYFKQAETEPRFKFDVEASYQVRNFTFSFRVNDVFNSYDARTTYLNENNVAVVDRNKYSPSFNFIFKYSVGKKLVRLRDNGADASRFK